MGELIEREIAVAAISAQLRNREMDSRVKVGLNNAKVTIQSLAAVDAVPVVHGRWKLIDGQYSKWQRCSECGVAIPDDAVHWCKATEDKNLNYCPHCGAKMDGGKE